MIEKVIRAKYLGEPQPGLEKDSEHVVNVQTNQTAMVMAKLEKFTSPIIYTSMKKFKKDWDELEELEKVKTVKMAPPKSSGKKADITIADAGTVIYTELVNAINSFNAKSATTYPDETQRPVFELRLELQKYSDSIREEQGLFGAGVVLLELKQYGLKRLVYQDGVSFKTEKELNNVAGFAPKLYINCLKAFVDSALLYILALNPDNIEANKAHEEAQAESIPTIGTGE